MKICINSLIKIYSVSLLLAGSFNVSVCKAQSGLLSDSLKDDIDSSADKFASPMFNTGEDPGSLVATIISAFLSLLGVIFVILIIIAGYNWMTANGEEEKVKKAKATIYRAIIGLLIIVAAYAITAFVFRNLPTGDGFR